MDYDWLINLPDRTGNIPVYQPDMGFLMSMQNKANQQYEQGLGEVKNAYASIFNQPVTGDAMNKRQQEYAKQAQDQMKDISASDLSNPKNVQIAENIMAPFHQDELLLRNIAGTQQLQSETQKALSARDSSDKEVRATYDGDALEYINHSAQELAGLPLTKDAYSKWRANQFVPAQDINADVDKAYKEAGEKGYTTTTSNGPNVYINHGGPGSREAFKTYYLSKVGNKYDAYLGMKASVSMYKDMDAIQRQNPGIDQATLYSKYAQGTVDDLNKHYQGAITGYDNSAKIYKAKVDKFFEGRTDDSLPPTAKEQADITQWRQQQLMNEKERDQYTEQYQREMGSGNPNDPKYQDMFKQVSYFPQDYISRVYKDRMADNWAIGKAALSQTEVKANEGWNNLEQSQLKMRDQAIRIWHDQQSNELGQDKLDEKKEEFYTRMGYYPSQDELYSYTQSSGASGSGMSGKRPIGNDITSGTVSRDVTDVTKIPNKLDTFRAAQTTLHNSINNEIYDRSGIAGLLDKDIVGDKGLDTIDIVNFSDGQKAILSGGKMTADQKAATIKARQLLTSLGVDEYNTANGKVDLDNDTLTTKLISAIPKMAAEIGNSDNLADRQKAINMTNRYLSVSKQRDTYLANEKAYNDGVNKFIASDKTGEYSKLYNHQTGKLISTDDMAKDFPAITIKDNDGNDREISSKEAAQMWKDGTFWKTIDPGAGGNLVKVGDKELGEHNFISNQFYKDRLAQELNHRLFGNTFMSGTKYQNPSTINSKYGNPGELGKLETTADNKVISSMGQAGKDGLIGKTVTYNLSDNDKDIQSYTGANIIKDAVLPENRTKIYTRDNDQGKPTELSKDETLAVQNMMSGNMKGIHGYATSVVPHTIGPNGTPAVEIKMQSTNGKEGKVAGQDVSKILNKGSVWVDVSSNAYSKLLRQFSERPDAYTYGDMITNDAPIKSDPALESFGLKYIVKPGSRDESGNNTKAYVEVSTYDLDPSGKIIRDTNNQPKWKTQKMDVGILGQNGKSPDEIMQRIYSFANTWGNDSVQRLSSSSQFPDPATQTSGQFKTMGDFRKTLYNN